MRQFLSILFLLSCFDLFSQNFTISGYVTDATGEPIVSAIVFEPISKKGIITNQYGFYSLSLQRNSYTLEFSIVGFEKQTIFINILNDTILNVKLKSLTLSEVEIKEKRSIVNEKIGSVTLPLEQIKKIPALGGEVDILKALSLTPGVSSGTEGSSGLFVRGGTPDQNLILLDDAVVYNPNHLFGFISVFNPDAIKNIELIKGGFPARYGGRLSSVVDVSMKEGALEKKKTNVGFGLLSSRFTIEKPLIKDKLGLMVSARSSYLTLILLPTRLLYNSSGNSDYINYWMYDANVKLNYKVNKSNQLIFSFYNGNDYLRSDSKSANYEESKAQINWGNSTMTIRHNKEITSKLW